MTGLLRKYPLFTKGENMKWIIGLLLIAPFVVGACQLRPTVPELPPKEARIAFMTNRNGNFEIYLMDRDGNNLTKLTDEAETNNILPAWSSRSRVFAYLADQAGVGLSIQRMDDEGQDQIILSGDVSVDPGPLFWSPTGEWVGFGAGRETNAEIYIADASGERVVNLSNSPAEDLFSGWSPDGDQVMFVSDRDGRLTVYLVGLDGQNPLQITSPTFDSGRPVWSPDGEQIAFMTNRDGGDIEIYTIDTTNGELTRLTNQPGFDGYPAWSPDGTKIAFLSDRDGNAEIYTVEPDGSNPTNLTNTPESNESVQGDFAWSPDGEQIMFQTDRDGNVEVYVMDADGNNQTNLTNDASIDMGSIWVQ